MVATKGKIASDEATTSAPAAETATHRSGVAFGLALAALAAYQMFKLPPALPVLLEHYGYHRVLAGGFMSVFALAGLALSLRVGRGVGRGGVWPYLAAAFILFLAGEALALAAPQSGWLVLLSRGLEGVGYAVCAVVGPLLANLNASRVHLPLVVGLTATWIPVGQVSANLLSIPTVGLGLWRPLWWAGIVFTLALAVWALALRRNPTLATGARRGETRHPVTATADERRALVLAAAVFCLWSGQYHAYMTWLPQYLVERLGFEPDRAVLVYTLPAAAVGLFCVVTGAALRAGAPLAALFAGSIAVQVAVWLLVPVTGDGFLGVVSLAAYGISSGVTPVCLFAMPSAVMGAERIEAGAFGVVMTGRNLGILLGPVLLAAMITLAGEWRFVWPLFSGASLIALLLALALVRRLRALGAARQGTRR
ncbi:MAG: MFS transporter [Alphaproteobacteria bacterium]